MSVFLTNSQSYTDLVRENSTAVLDVLHASCSVDTAKCTTILSNLNTDLFQNNTCLGDYENGINAALQAFNALSAYPIVHQATCLTYNYTVNQSNNTSLSSTSLVSSNSGAELATASATLSTASSSPTLPANISTNSTAESHSQYCYYSALYENKNDGYMYLLPLGFPYPNSSDIEPSCSSCNQRVMEGYFAYTGNNSNAISFTYDSAAKVLDSRCAPNFVDPRAKVDPRSKRNSAASLDMSLITVWKCLLCVWLLVPFM